MTWAMLIKIIEKMHLKMKMKIFTYLRIKKNLMYHQMKKNIMHLRIKRNLVHLRVKTNISDLMSKITYQSQGAIMADRFSFKLSNDYLAHFFLQTILLEFWKAVRACTMCSFSGSTFHSAVFLICRLILYSNLVVLL